MKFPLNIAILGAGLAGLATGFFLSQKIACKITFYDPSGTYGAASAISAGILHKYGGLHAKKSPFAEEGERATLELIEIVKNQSNQNPILNRGILRLALNEVQLLSYKKAADLHNEIEWIPEEKCQTFYPFIPKKPAIYISSGLVIDSFTYLDRLFHTINGAKLIPKSISPQEAVAQYDLVIYAMGTKTPFIKTAAVKGQLIELEWPAGMPPLRMGLVSQVYICQNRTLDRAIVGATYEHQFNNEFPDQERAAQELLPKAIELLPMLQKAKIISVKAALRASTPNHLPLFGRISNKEWYLSGLGSKGLLYHALYAKKLVDLILVG